MPLQTVTLKFADKSFKLKNATFSADEEHPLSAAKKKNGSVDFYQNSVIRITPAGKVTAVGVGTTTVTATSGSAVKKFTITVNAPVTTEVYLNAGQSEKLKYYNVKPANAKWSKTDENGLISVSDKGQVTASGKGTGKAVVTCEYDPYMLDDVDDTGFVYTTVVYVEDVKLKAEGGLVEKKAGTAYTLDNMAVGEQYVLKITGASQPVIFTSSKPAVAFADDAGIIYARGKGTAKLTASVNGKKITVTVTVK